MTSAMTRLRWPMLAVLVGLLMLLMAPAALAQTTPTTQLGVPLTPSSTTEATGTTGTTAAAAGSLISPKSADFKELNPGLTFPEASVQFLPEYDTADGEVLVIINYQLPQGVKLPLNYQFRIPHNARLTGYALLDPQGNFDYNRPTPQVTPGTEWDLVSAQVPRDQPVHIEYYYKPSGLDPTGARSFVADYEAPAALDTLTVAVQQPARATDFVLTPPFGQSSPDAEGLTVFTTTAAKVTPGEHARVQVAYNKPDANPSKSSATDSPETQASQNYLVWLLIAMVVGVAGFVAYRMISNRRTPAVAGGGRATGGGSRTGSSKAATTPRKGKAAAPDTGPQRFCTNCGAKLTKNDRFCPQCGQERE